MSQATPGVYQNIVDQSYTPPPANPGGLAVVGPTQKGQAFVPTNVSSFNQYTALFGLDTAHTYVPQAAYNYLQEGNNVLVTRVLGNGGWFFNSTNRIAAIVSGSTILTVFHPSQNSNGTSVNLNSSSLSGSYSNFKLVLNGTNVADTVSGSLDLSNSNFITKVLGSDQFFQTGAAYPYLNFNNYYTGSVTGSSSASLVLSTASCTFTSSFTEGYSHAVTPWVLSAAGVQLFRFHHISDGFASNTDVKVGINSININQSSTIYTTFNVVVRSANDTERTPNVLETYSNVTLNPDAPNYIELKIGSKYSQYDTVTGKVITHGDYDNISSYIRIEVSPAVFNGSTHPNDAPSGFSALYETIAGFTGYHLPSASFVSSNSGSTLYSGFDYYNPDNQNYLNPIPLEAGNGVNAAFTLPVNDNKFILPFQGGSDGMSYSIIKGIGSTIATDGSNVFGFNLSSAAASGYSAFKKAIDILSNSYLYSFNLLSLPGIIEEYHGAVTAYVDAMVNSRQDNIYIRDLTGRDDNVAKAISVVAGLDNLYSATYYPWIQVIDIGTGKKVYMPPSVMVPQAVAYSDSISAPWFSVAGAKRGTLGGAIDTKNRLSQAEIGLLNTAHINSITKKGSAGVIIWGNDTLQEVKTALSSLNVVRLIQALQAYIGNVADNLVWDPNTNVLYNTFKTKVNTYLEGVQANQGVYTFEVQMDTNTTTFADVDNLTVNGVIKIQPTRDAEFINLTYVVSPTGTVFS